MPCAGELRGLDRHLFADGLRERHAVEDACAHRANPTARVSRITTTRIWPGYWSSFSIRFAICSLSAAACDVVDLVRGDHDPNLASRLDDVALLHALEGVGDLLERA